MDEDEEYVGFKVTSDDLEYELDPMRSFRKQTKDQAIYGIWSVDDDKAGKQRQDAKSYYKTVGVNFVSGGVTEVKPEQENDSGPEKDVSDDDIITDSENDDDDFRQVLSGPSRNSTKDNNQSQPGPSQQNNNSGPNRNSFGAVKAATAYRASNDFGNWEKYTRGIGYKLLDKMGYIPGKGLGRSNQGIVNPVAAKKRKGKAGVGAMGPEHENEDFLGANDAGSDKKGANNQGAAQNQKRQWRKPKQGEKSKAEYTYVTIEDLRKRAVSTKAPDFSALGNVKVIDRTGPQAKYLHGYEELARQYKKPASDDEEALSEGEVATRGSLGSRAAFAGVSATGGFHMPELVHNINKIVSSLEQQIIKADQTSLRSEDKMVHLKYEEERLGKQYNEEEEEIDRLSDLIRCIQDICQSEKHSTPQPVSANGSNASDVTESQMKLKQITERFHTLKRQFASEFVLYELHNLTVALVFPKVKAAIASWDIATPQTSPLKEFETWKEILKDNRDTQNIYAHMIWDFWMPKIRRFILSSNIRESEALIELLENWNALIPSNIFINLTEQFLIPRLQSELDAWNPVTDVVPVHSWIHPWLPLMGDRLQPLYVTIRAKLASCLVNWDPTDRSAKLIIEPWRDVFSKGEMEAFLIKAICPKLKMALHLMPIDSTNTGIEILRSVLLWHDLLSQHQLSQILVTHFFPRWISTLCAWLSNSPNFEQVEKWYRAWRNEFPVHILAVNSVKLSFKQAMDILNRAVTGGPVAGMQYVCPDSTASPVLQQRHKTTTSGNLGYMPASAADGYVPQSILNLQRQSGMDSSSPMMQLDTFRDLVERRCADLNLLFAPIPGVFHDAKQVYTLGTLKVCIDKGVIFVNRGGGGTKWQPMSLPAVLSHAK